MNEKTNAFSPPQNGEVGPSLLTIKYRAIDLGELPRPQDKHSHPLQAESRRKLSTVHKQNPLQQHRSHLHKVFNQWKDSDRLIRSSTLQFNKEIRRNIQMIHLSLDYLPESIIPKKQ
ncbi:hypothetical protein NPIL_223311 [Nephila pilipes]|uniref:Uncharacterized protein n=1 Tax=Nephila pilipes TaxID=299642 RepID=A0A8X6IQA5_NEPPI|nr:hypothetical protein NPIL_223311 [Nephila pilipes]